MTAHPSLPTPDLGAIFDEHFDYVWVTLRRLGVRDCDLEDLAHEVFLKVHARLANYDATRPLRPWLFGFAYRVASDHRRLARHRVEVIGAPAEAIDPGLPADEHLEAHEEHELLEVALDAVPIDRRTVLLLHDVDDLPVPAIAEQLGIPLNTAYSRLRLARDDLAHSYLRLRRARTAKMANAGWSAKRGGAQ